MSYRSEPATIVLNGVSWTVTQNADGKWPCPFIDCPKNGFSKRYNSIRHLQNVHKLPELRRQHTTIQRTQLNEDNEVPASAHPYSSSASSPEPVDQTPGMSPPSPLQTNIDMQDGAIDWTCSWENSPKLSNFGLAVLQPVGIYVCVPCGYGVLPNQIAGHMTRVHRVHSLKKDVANELMEEHGLTEGTDPRRPPPGIPPLSHLNTYDGIACPDCPWVGREAEKLKLHTCTAQQRTHAPGRRCRVQTLFAPQKGGGYIEVASALVPPVAVFSASVLVELEMQAEKLKYNPPIIPLEDSRLTAPFPRIANWTHWLGNRTWKDIKAQKQTMEAPRRLKKDCKEILIGLRADCTAKNYGSRCQINSAT